MSLVLPQTIVRLFGRPPSFTWHSLLPCCVRPLARKTRAPKLSTEDTRALWLRSWEENDFLKRSRLSSLCRMEIAFRRRRRGASKGAQDDGAQDDGARDRNGSRRVAAKLPPAWPKVRTFALSSLTPRPPSASEGFGPAGPSPWEP